MYITWRHECSEPRPGDTIEDTVACVADGVIEWREILRDGTRTVTAAKFAKDGRLLRAWRGPPGGPALPLRVVADEDPAEMRRKVNAMGSAYGISTDDVEFDREEARETLRTPAGEFVCTRRTIKSSLLFMSMRADSWYSVKPLPLSSLVKSVTEFRPKGPIDTFELIAYGREGARPTLAPPR
jgi:hypothetical protein